MLDARGAGTVVLYVHASHAYRCHVHEGCGEDTGGTRAQHHTGAGVGPLGSPATGGTGSPMPRAPGPRTRRGAGAARGDAGGIGHSDPTTAPSPRGQDPAGVVEERQAHYPCCTRRGNEGERPRGAGAREPRASGAHRILMLDMVKMSEYSTFICRAMTLWEEARSSGLFPSAPAERTPRLLRPSPDA